MLVYLYYSFDGVDIQHIFVLPINHADRFKMAVNMYSDIGDNIIDVMSPSTYVDEL